MSHLVRIRAYAPYAACIAALLLFIPIYFLLVPPLGVPASQIVRIPADSTSETIATTLANQHVVRSALEFKIWTRLTGEDRALQSGVYVFAHPLGLAAVAHRIAQGEHGITESRVTLTEGMTTRDMADTFAAELPGFNSAAYLRAASTSSGYLFPDTYFILPGMNETDIVALQRTTFTEKVPANEQDETTVILASILEREAKGSTDQALVAGILSNRLRLGMPLQVDAAPETYHTKGLPTVPIANPGLVALAAAHTPTKTSYLYYLTGTDGTMHYAKMFAEHQANIAKYLKK